jgi:hypothetical protein
VVAVFSIYGNKVPICVTLLLETIIVFYLCTVRYVFGKNGFLYRIHMYICMHMATERLIYTPRLAGRPPEGQTVPRYVRAVRTYMVLVMVLSMDSLTPHCQGLTVWRTVLPNLNPSSHFSDFLF